MDGGLLFRNVGAVSINGANHLRAIGNFNHFIIKAVNQLKLFAQRILDSQISDFAIAPSAINSYAASCFQTFETAALPLVGNGREQRYNARSVGLHAVALQKHLH